MLEKQWTKESKFATAIANWRSEHYLSAFFFLSFFFFFKKKENKIKERITLNKKIRKY